MAARRDSGGAYAVTTMADPVTDPVDLPIAPGAVVVVRDEEWLVRETEQTGDGLLVHVEALRSWSANTRACFYRPLDDIRPLDPPAATESVDAIRVRG